MELSAKNVSITGIIALVGALGALEARFGLWQYVGWNTPSRHAVDVAAIEGKYDTLAGEVASFQDLYLCKEWTKELLDRLERQQAGNNTPQNVERIRRLRELIRTNNCDQFEL